MGSSAPASTLQQQSGMSQPSAFPSLVSVGHWEAELNICIQQQQEGRVGVQFPGMLGGAEHIHPSGLLL